MYRLPESDFGIFWDFTFFFFFFFFSHSLSEEDEKEAEEEEKVRDFCKKHRADPSVTTIL